MRGADGVTVVEMAGLGRSESAKLPEELADLAVTLNAVAPTAPGPDTDPDPDPDPGTPGTPVAAASSAEPSEGAEK